MAEIQVRSRDTNDISTLVQSVAHIDDIIDRKSEHQAKRLLTNSNPRMTLARVLQFAISVVLLGLSSKLTADRGHLTDLTSGLNELRESFNVTELGTAGEELIPQYHIDTGWQYSVLALSGPAFQSFVHPFLAGVSQQWSSSVVKASGLTKSQDLYIGATGGSELGLFSIYFTSFIFQLIEFGRFNCNDVSNLLQMYNLTTNQYEQELLVFLGIPQPSLYNLTSEFIFNNFTYTELQSELLLAMSSNCDLKKASIGMNSVLIFIFLYTGQNLVQSGIQLFKQYRSARAKISDRDNKDNETEFSLVFRRHIDFPVIQENSVEFIQSTTV